METQHIKEYIQEDEIDLRELFNTLYEHKLFISLFTLFITFLAILYAYIKTPIYEVKSNVQIGFISDKLVDNSDVIVRKLNIIFNVKDKQKTKKKFISEVSSITKNKKLKNFIEIKTEAITNNDALQKNKEVVEYLQKLYSPKFNQYILNTKNKINSLKQQIKNLDNFGAKNIQRQIELLKTQTIAKIDEKIKFYKNIKISALNAKIKFYTNNLKKYSVAINNLYKNNNNNKDSTIITISSIQMVNYQNLILDSQNKLEDLKIEIEKIRNETIPNLQRDKENILNDDVRKLQQKLTVDLPNKKAKFQEQIEQLRFKISAQNIQNSQVVGHYIVHDYPAKPKKKLIIVVAFVTGFILAIFLALFFTFIKNKEIESKNDNNDRS